MARVETEQSDVLLAIVDRLVDQIPALSRKNCFISILPNPPYKVPDNVFVTVSPTGGTFPEDLLVGGGAHQCNESAGVLVTVFSRFMAQRTGHDAASLTDFTRGVLRMKRLILKALTAHDLQFERNSILSSLMLPTDSGPPEPIGDPAENLVQVSVKFGTDFDWNLDAT